MNKKRMAKLQKAKQQIREGLNLVNMILDQEEDHLDNIPENLQSSDLYQRMSDNVEYLYSVTESLEGVIDNIEFIK